jgi:hypothetical protein
MCEEKIPPTPLDPTTVLKNINHSDWDLCVCLMVFNATVKCKINPKNLLKLRHHLKRINKKSSVTFVICENVLIILNKFCRRAARCVK